MRWTPTIARISVVFPQPLGPSRPVTERDATRTLRHGSTTRPPRETRRPSISIAARASWLISAREVGGVDQVVLERVDEQVQLDPHALALEAGELRGDLVGVS